MLFNKIQDGEFNFPQGEWKSISEDAKDLISHMLVRDPHKRYAAFEVLQHPWVAKEASRIQLATPIILQRYVGVVCYLAQSHIIQFCYKTVVFEFNI